MNSLKTRKKTFFVFYYALFYISISLGQNNLVGKVKNHKYESIEFANVLLLNKTDSTLVKGSVTNNNGEYVLEDVAHNEYILSISLIGFKSQYLKVKITKKLQEMPDVFLKEDITILEEVNIIVKKNMFEQKIDRLVINVKNSITSTGANVLEVLAKSPGIRIDGINNQITINGNQGVILQINGKRSRISGEALIQLLEAMPSDNIDKIELITTPPASYDAEGTAGIINIVSVKNRKQGFNGSFSLNTGYGDRGKFGGTININAKTKRFNIFMDVSINNNYVQENVSIFKTIKNDSDIYVTETFSDRPAFRGLYNGRIGVDYKLNNNTTIEMLLSGYINIWKLDANTFTQIKLNDILTETSTLQSKETDNWKHWSSSINMYHSFKDKSKFSIAYDYLNYKNNNPTDYIDIVSNSNFSVVNERKFISRKENPISFHVIKTDYSRVVSEKSKFEVGLKTSISSFTNDNKLADVVSGVLEYNPLYTNFNELDENIFGAYSTLDWEISPKILVKAGVRYEYTDINLSDKEQTITERKYGKFFPSAFLSYDFDDDQSINFSYSERIQRPSLRILASSFFFFSPNTLTSGNPQVKETITKQFKIQYKLKKTLLTCQYSNNKLPIVWGQPQVNSSENITLLTPENLKDSKSLMLSMSFPLKFTKWWESRYSITSFWQQFNPIINGNTLRQEGFFGWIYASSTFKLPKKINIEINGSVSNKYSRGIENFPSRGSFNIGFQKTFKTQSKLTLNWSDVFNLGSFYKSSYNRPDLNIVYVHRYEKEGSILKLSYLMNLGNSKKNQGSHIKEISSDERNRVE